MKVTLLDSLFAKCVKLEMGAVYQEYGERTYLFGNCEYCGEFLMLQCSHFHGRVRLTTRWYEDNISVICGACHKMFEEHPDLHTEWFKKRLGSGRFEKLSIRAMKTIKELSIDKEQLTKDLKERIRILEG